MATPDGTSSAFGATYAVNDESEKPFAAAMRKERYAVESGKSNDAPEDAAVQDAQTFLDKLDAEGLVEKQ